VRGVGGRLMVTGSAAAGAAATAAGVADGRTSVVRAVQPVTATAAANTNTVMIRAGRMATFSLVKQPCGSRSSAWRRSVTAGRRAGVAATAKRLDPVAIVDQNKHTARA
jgi:hypothetical protein